jgi:hypothetical protein
MSRYIAKVMNLIRKFKATYKLAVVDQNIYQKEKKRHSTYALTFLISIECTCFLDMISLFKREMCSGDSPPCDLHEY